MLRTKVEHESFWVQQFSKEQSNDSWVDDLTKLEDLREVVVSQSMKHQQTLRQYHARNISSHSFKIGECILQKKSND
jgi:hypothetical protein